MKKYLYKNIDEALADLNAKDRGRYFLCTCPECKEHEAFIYKNNTNFIQCSRENECGERMLLQYKSKEDILSFQQEEDYPSLSKEQVKSLDTLTRFTKYMQYNTASENLDDGFRGLSRESTEPFIADLGHPINVKKFFEYGKGLFSNDYSKNDWMTKRNLVFPMYGDNGMIERILLRSTIDPTIEPKEIQLIVDPSKDTRDFFVDIPNDTETIVITEAVLDGASFREVYANLGIFALTGSAKNNKLCTYLKEHQDTLHDKKIILALDDDKAGWKATENIIDALNELSMDYEVFSYPQNIKDGNQYLQEDRGEFVYSVYNVLSSFIRQEQYQSHKEHPKKALMER